MFRAFIAVLLSLVVCGSAFAASQLVEGTIKVTTDAVGIKTYTFTVKEGGKEVPYAVESNLPEKLDGIFASKDGQTFKMPSSMLAEKDGTKIARFNIKAPGPELPTGPQTVIGVLRTAGDKRSLTTKTGDSEVVYTVGGEGKMLSYAYRDYNGKTVEVVGEVTRTGAGLTLYAHAMTGAPVKVTGVLKVAAAGMTVTAKEGGKDVVYNLSRPDDPNRSMSPEVKAITEKAKAFDGKTVEVVGVVYENVPGLGLVLDQREIKDASATK